MTVAKRVVVADKTPNSLYHGHHGFIQRYLLDTNDGTALAEVVWQEPYPVANLSRQVMDIVHLVAVDDSRPLDFYLIFEEV